MSLECKEYKSMSVDWSNWVHLWLLEIKWNDEKNDVMLQKKCICFFATI